jgi:hypothetical protein
MPVGSTREAFAHGLSQTGPAIDPRLRRGRLLADANEVRDWRIYAEFAQRLIAQARRLYAGESLLGNLDSTVYAFDSTTMDLCLSLFPWAHFRSTKTAVKMHTLLDLRGNIPSFIHISDGKLHDVNALDLIVPEAGAIYVMDRGYVDFTRLYVLHQAGAFFVTRAKSNPRVKPVGMPQCASSVFRPDGSDDRRNCRSDDQAGWALYEARVPRAPPAGAFSGRQDRKNTCVPDQPDSVAGFDDLRSV